jgi:hypothetical protein
MYDNGIGVQELRFYAGIYTPCVGGNTLNKAIESRNDISGIEVLANNDGLSLKDFKDWFKGYDLSQPMAIIHFTKFRY